MNWKEQIQRIADSAPGRVSLLLCDARSGEVLLEREADRRVVSASTIKAAILLAALEEVRFGRADLREPVFVPKEDILSDSEVFDRGEKALPLDELLRWMIITSDNTATNAVLRRFGMDRVNAYCEKCGWTSTRVERLMLDYAAIERGRNNYTSARDQGALFCALYRGELLTKALCAYALRVFLAQRCKDDFFRYIPFPLPAAHKTGSLEGIDHDSGLLRFPNRPTVYFGAFVTDAPGEGAGRPAIGEMARCLFDAFCLEGEEDPLCLPGL